METNAMSNDERVKKLSEKISDSLSYSDALPNTKPKKINRTEIKKLAKEIRPYIEDYDLEDNSHSRASYTTK